MKSLQGLKWWADPIRPKAFTLVELLVVIAIVGILIALLLRIATPPLPGLSELIFMDFSGPSVLEGTSLPTEYQLDNWPFAVVYLGADSPFNGIVAQIYLIEPVQAGDYDQDGDVDGNDRVQWEGDFNANGQSDAEQDGDSDGSDFLVWQRQFGSGVSPLASSYAIPEPSTFMLILVLVTFSVLASCACAI